MSLKSYTSLSRFFAGLLPRALLLTCFVLLADGTAFGSDAGLRNHASRSSSFAERFLHPPAEARILKIIHNWPDAAAEQDDLIQRLAHQNFGGVVCNVSFTDYLTSEKKWSAFTRAVAAARQAGFALWLYDERGYPSGTAGGIVLREHPEWEARGLLIADAEGEAEPLTIEVPPGQPFLLAAYPVHDGQVDFAAATNLQSRLQGKTLSWTPPAGRWHMLAITESPLFEGTHASMSLSDHIPYPNLLQPEPIRQFLQVTHQAYADRLGTDLGKYFISTFTDEPSLMSLFLRRMPYRVLPWSPDLPRVFKKRHGYRLEPNVTALVANVGPSGQRIRYDYWQTIGDLVSESYFGQIQSWCSRHQLQSGGHLLMEEDLVAHVPLYGDFFQCLRRLDAPSIDCLTSIPSQVPWYIARLAGSAADLENRPTTMCETSDHGQRYRPAGDKRPVVNVTEEQIRGTCNRLIVGGIDTITSYYSFAGLSDEQLRRLNDWIGRCCAAVKGGHRVSDVAVVYPIQSVWPRFNPAHRHVTESPEASRIEALFHGVSESLFMAGRDFSYVDARTLAEAKVSGGALVHGQQRWRVVVLPGADTLPMAAWENLIRLVRSGGAVIAVGRMPANSATEFPSARVQSLARKFFRDASESPSPSIRPRSSGAIFLSSGSAGRLPSLLNRILPPDIEISGPTKVIRPTHRRIDGKEVYFLINDSAQPWNGRVSLAAEGAGEQGDPATGQLILLANGKDVPLTLPGYGAAVFRFSKAKSTQPLRLAPGVGPGLTILALPAVEPVVGRGEFVREEFSLEPGPSDKTNASWRAKAVLTRSQVDTFLFVRFPYSSNLDLSGTTWLELDTWVPAAQATANELLVVLCQKNGAEYLANTSRLLSAPGHEKICLPYSQFKLAGWSTDPGGRLDLSSITEIRVGWGGYYGSEGEKVEFTLTAPRAVTDQAAASRP